MKNLIAYTMPRPFNGYNIPISFQSTIIRDYANKNDLILSLSINEVVTSKSYAKLNEILKSKGLIKNLVVVSGFVLPIHDHNLLNKIFLKYKKSKVLRIHLILESEVLTFNEFKKWSKNIVLKQKIISTFN